MTSKEIYKEFHDLIWDGTEGTPEHINRLEYFLSEFALQVAAEAVAEEQEMHRYDSSIMAHVVRKSHQRILKNIKKRLDVDP